MFGRRPVPTAESPFTSWKHKMFINIVQLPLGRRAGGEVYIERPHQPPLLSTVQYGVLSTVNYGVLWEGDNGSKGRECGIAWNSEVSSRGEQLEIVQYIWVTQ